ncbi:hypothetical protein H0E87_020615 [Populus deltoides]|uniref:Uncharacterized protein n=1 Tax=Populus deltoides TaxID=3696 RepID=A0A8T2XK45_POPDE|nr:hypothetical protein H0E87_020615 [Populus deltoides]
MKHYCLWDGRLASGGGVDVPSKPFWTAGAKWSAKTVIEKIFPIRCCSMDRRLPLITTVLVQRRAIGRCCNGARRSLERKKMKLTVGLLEVDGLRGCERG